MRVLMTYKTVRQEAGAEVTYDAGAKYEVDDATGREWIGAGWAQQIADRTDAPQAKAVRGAPENKHKPAHGTPSRRG